MEERERLQSAFNSSLFSQRSSFAGRRSKDGDDEAMRRMETNYIEEFLLLLLLSHWLKKTPAV